MAPTEITKKKAKMLMDYLHTYPNATIRYYARNMVLVFETDAAYLVLSKAWSRIAGWYVLTSDPSKTNSVVKNLLLKLKTVYKDAFLNIKAYNVVQTLYTGKWRPWLLAILVHVWLG